MIRRWIGVLVGAALAFAAIPASADDAATIAAAKKLDAQLTETFDKTGRFPPDVRHTYPATVLKALTLISKDSPDYEAAQTLIRKLKVRQEALLERQRKARWRATSFKDRMTDKEYSFVSLSPETSDVPATLEIGCVNRSVQAYVSIPSRRFFIAPYIRYRIDDRAPVTHKAVLGSNERVYLDSVTALKEAKRFRLEVIPDGGGQQIFSDFDLAGIKDAVQVAKCPR